MRYAVLAQVLALVVGLTVALARGAGFLQEGELVARDRCFQLRYRWQGPGHNPGVALVTIDARSLQELKLPMALWRPQTVQVIRNLLRGGARVVAPDVLYELDPASLTTPAEKPLGQQLQAAEVELAHLLHDEPVLLGAQVSATQELHLPRPALQLSAQSNLVLVNLAEDRDGAVRFYEFYRTINERMYPYLALRAAELARPDLLQYQPTEHRYLWRSQPIPRADRYDYSLYINYLGPAGTLPRYSFVDVLAGQHVAEQIVLLGNDDPRLGDRYRTPFSQRGELDMSGVEIHANALATLLSGRFLTPAGSLLNLLVIVGLAWLTGRLAWTRPPLQVLGGALVAVAGWTLVALAAFVSRGWWLEFVGPWVSVPLACLLVYALRSRTIERDRARLVSTFGRMVSSHVMEAVLRDPTGLAQRTEREVTVLFTDINNFTPTCEASTPAQVLDMLSDYFTAMVGVILKHDGYIKQYVGDEIMVIFGAPHQQEDHAVRAVQAALEMQDVLARQALSGRPGFYDIKLGINTGPVILGPVGSAERWEYAAVGDDVNLGSRIMGLTKKLDSNLLVSEATRQRAQADLPEVEWVPYGEQEFKGKSRRVAVYGVRRKGGA